MAKSAAKKSNVLRAVSGVAVAAAAVAMSVNPQVGTVKQANEITVNQHQKATASETKVSKEVTRHNVNGSGLDLVTRGAFGLTPKEYGIKYGHGNRRSKTNFLRLAHNHKVRKRAA